MKKIIFLLLVIVTGRPTFADTFTVTSNADSGPGTLREAITLANANGTAVDDIINFNISDVTESGRTITLLTALPAISSNVTIDASTQPGTLLGISSAGYPVSGSLHAPAIHLSLYTKNHWRKRVIPKQSKNTN